MKIVVRKSGMYWRGIMYWDEIVEFHCPGNGTKADPFIFTPETHPPRFFKIIGSDKHVIMKNTWVRELTLDSSENVSLIDCSIERLSIINSTNCLLENCNLKYGIFLLSSKNNIIRNCETGWLVLKKAHENKIIENKIQELSIKKSSYNELDSNIVQYSKIQDVNNYLIIENGNFPQIYLKNSNKVIFNKINVESILVWKSSKISIIDCSIEKSLTFEKHRSVLIEDCEINKLIIRRSKANADSKPNTIQDCTISSLDLKRAQDIKIINNEIGTLISKNLQKEILNENKIKKNESPELKIVGK